MIGVKSQLHSNGFLGEHENGLDGWGTNQQVTYYVAAGNQPSVSLGVNPDHVAAKLPTSVELTGYFVSAP